jgi:YegS/Rv2252/BmrU family lipid kinase
MLAPAMARDVVQQNAERVLVIVNPRAGRGRALRTARDLAIELQRHEVPFSVWHTRRPGDATALAAQTTGAVIAVGGDGTVHEVLNGLPAHEGRLGPFGVLPAGSGDDFAACAGFGRDPQALAERVRRGHVRAVDVGSAAIECEHGVIERRFANFAAIGFAAEVAARAHRARLLRGRLLYVVATLRALVRQRPVACELSFDDGEVENTKVLFAAACNGGRIGAGLPFSPDAKIDDGRLDVLRVLSDSRLATLSLLKSLMRRAHLADPRVRLVRCARASLRTAHPVPAALDGEPVAARATSLAARLLAERLLVFAP